MNQAINAAIIQRSRILLAFKHDVYILPGGKPQAGDVDEHATLRREMREEFSGTELEDLHYYASFQGVTPHSKKPLEARVYFARLAGPLWDPTPGDSVTGFAWVAYAGLNSYHVSAITRTALDALHRDGHF